MFHHQKMRILTSVVQVCCKHLVWQRLQPFSPGHPAFPRPCGVIVTTCLCSGQWSQSGKYSSKECTHLFLLASCWLECNHVRYSSLSNLGLRCGAWRLLKHQNGRNLVCNHDGLQSTSGLLICARNINFYLYFAWSYLFPCLYVFSIM